MPALSNRGGGKIVFGISDKRPRKVIGSQAFAQPEQTIERLKQQLHVRVDFTQLNEGEKRVLVITVAGRPVGLPVQAKGIAWWRDGESLIPMPQEVQRSIYEESGHDFSGDVCPQAVMDDLDPNAIAAFRNSWYEKTGNARLKTLTDEQLLQDCEAILPEGITYAALILFGKHRSLGRLLPQAETIFEYRSSNASGPAQQREEFREGFFLYYQRIWELINLRNNRQHYQTGLFVFDILTFNERVVREALLNAISHRNYQLGGSVFLRQYQDRLVVESPGGFPPGITLDNILERQAPRNRRIAEIFAKCGLVERSGQGMNLIYELSIQEAKGLPDFQGTDAYQVRLTLHGLVLDPQLLKMLRDIGEETLALFTTEDFLIIDALTRGQKLPPHLAQKTNALIELGVVEKIGRSTFLLSRRYYEAIGQAGVHTRKVGLDRETNKALLLKHIRDYNATGSNLATLQQVLPAKTRDQIRYLLRQLREEKKIYVKGTQKSARWYCCDSEENP